MTQSKVIAASNSSNADNSIKPIESSIQELKNNDTILTLDSTIQPELIIDNSKNLISKSQTTKSKKGESKNVSKEKVEINQRLTRNQIKKKAENSELKDVDIQNNKKNGENKSSGIKKNRRSSEHKLTEYFQSLKVSRNKKDATLEETKLEQVKENDNDEKIEEKGTSNVKKQSFHASQKSDRKSRHKVKLPSEPKYHKVTDYFRIRRSERKYKKDIEFERELALQSKILNHIEEGLEVKEFEGKGRGIVTTREFFKGDFVIEYIGDLIDKITAEKREIEYSKNTDVGCYMYYFKHKDIQYCIDATEESGKLGRLINHSRKGNLVSKILDIDDKPHLVLFAKTNIPAGVEVLYDYGDRNRESVKNHPWLNL